MNKIYSFTIGCMLLVHSMVSFSQCDSVVINSNYLVDADVLMSGTYVINGNFTLASGVTIFITPYSNNSCGSLKIYANNITIDGTINGDYAGFVGGAGGIKGQQVLSQTGNAASLTTCDNSGNNGHIAVEGGFAGQIGMGPGAGLPGNNGTNGSGSKQYCGNVGDEAGLVGGAGGAGGGAGGSYGGLGSNGSTGGNGNSTATATDLPISVSYVTIAGTGGAGGLQGAVYGTSNLRDIQLGSGGAGAGAGGRSFYVGSNGGKGGNGGGMVFLKAQNNLSITGVISVLGENGTTGGTGGTGDASPDCCSDGCNGCDERTFSAGAGAGSGSGAGSGGGIFIESLGNATISGQLIASGGNGGAGGTKGNGATCDYDGGFICGTQSIITGNGTNGNLGGAGSGGRIKIFVATCSQATINPTVVNNGGTGFGVAENGTYQEVCGYAGINEGEISLGWSVFPNPATDQLTVQILSDLDFSSAKISVINTLGMEVINESLEGIETTLNLQQLSKGFYTVILSTASSSEMKHIIKN